MRETAAVVARPPASAEANPLMQAAAELSCVARTFQDEIERDGRIPPALVEQLRAAGLYGMVVPAALGGRQVDLTTFLGVAEVLAEGDASVGWNLANNATNQLTALSLTDAGVQEVFGGGPDTIIAGTTVQVAAGPYRSMADTRSAGGGRSAAAAGRASGCWPTSRWRNTTSFG